MSDNMRYRKEFHKPRWFAVDSATVIEQGDMLWLDTDDVKPASSFVWDTSLAVTQRAFVKKFVGVAQDRHPASGTSPIQVNMSGVHEMTCASATFELEGYVSPAKASGNALENQKVATVTDATLAIGKVAQREASAVTTVKFEIQGGKEPGQYNSPEEIVVALESLGAGSRLDSDYIDEGATNKFASTANVAAAGAVMDSDFSAAEGVMRKTGAGAYTAHKSNLAAAVAPAVTDDTAAGYSVGSIWIDTTADNAYVCVDSSAGAAVWLQYMTVAQVSKLAGIEALADVTDATNVAAAGAVMDSDIAPGEGILRKTGAGAYTAHKSNLAAAVAPVVTDDTAAGYSVGSIWIDTTGDAAYVCVDSSTAAAVWLQMLTQANAAKVANLTPAKLFTAAYTAVAGDDTANQAEIDTGFGVAPTGWIVQVLRSAVDVTADAIITALGGGDAGKIRIADGAATYVVTAGDVMNVWAWKS